MTRIAVSHAIGEGIFNCDFTWRTNSGIIGPLIGYLARAKVEKWAMIRLCHNIFDPVWRLGLEEAIMSSYKKLRTPLQEMYMAHPPRNFDLAIVPRCPSLVIQELSTFNLVRPKMDANIQFILRWRGIIKDGGKAWLKKHLEILKSYIHLSVELENLEEPELYILNIEKSSRKRVPLNSCLNSSLKTPRTLQRLLWFSEKSSLIHMQIFGDGKFLYFSS